MDPTTGWSTLREDPGLCRACRHVLLTRTRRGPSYVRCGRAAWDDRLIKYPRLPVRSCVGFEPAGEDHGLDG